MNYFDGFKGPENREMVFEEKLKWVLANIKRCHEEFFPLLYNVASEPSQENWQKLCESELASQVFSSDLYQFLLCDKVLKDAVNHDLNDKIVFPLIGYHDIFLAVKNQPEKKVSKEEMKKHAIRLLNYGLPFIFVAEDLIIRRLTINKKNTGESALVTALSDKDMQLAEKSLRACKIIDLFSALRANGVYKDDHQKVDLSHASKNIELADDEKIKIIPGMIINAVYNIARNGIKPRGERTAQKAFISMDREGDEVVFRVSNDGAGLPKERIVKDNREENIFAGKSTEQGQGWGVRGLPDRMTMAGANFKVWSRTGGVWHDSETQKDGEKESVPPFEILSDVDGVEHNLNVIFEIRLPITKKIK